MSVGFSESSDLFDRIEAFVGAGQSGAITSVELNEFEQLLRQSEDAQVLYLDLIEMSVYLPRALAGAATGRDDGDHGVATGGDGHAVPHSSFTIQPSSSSPILTFLPTVLHTTLGYFSSNWLVSYSIATVIMGIGALIAGFTYVSHPVQIAEQLSVITEKGSATEPPRGYVGRITGMVDCKWAKGSDPLFGNGAVSLGREFNLDSGLMEIGYNTGARVILQGPVTYVVESKNGGFMSIGKLTGKVTTANAKGFSVRTPTATVTDLGTEFGVEVTRDRATDVHVFRGRVLAEFVGDVASPARTLELSEGNAVRLGDKGAAPAPSPSIATPAAFVRTMPHIVRELATRCPIVFCSGSWAEEGQDWSPVGLVGPWRVTDGWTNDDQPTFWLGREKTSNEYFIISLCGQFEIERLELLNTHNREFNDRGTKDFEIWAADKINAEHQLIEPRLILRGTLPCRYETGSKTPFDVYSAAKQDFAKFSARYIKFVAKTYYGSGCGLNEIRAFGVPDSTSSGDGQERR